MFLVSEKSLSSPTQLCGMKNPPLSKSTPWHWITGQPCPSPGLQLEECRFTGAFCWIPSASTDGARPKATSAWAVIRTQETLLLSGPLSVVWLEIRDWMISSPLGMSNLDIFPRLVCFARMSFPLYPLLLTLKIELVSRSSHSGDYSEVGAQSPHWARTATKGLGDIVKRAMNTHFITCCTSSLFLF